jgi:hypothetical protein
MAKVSKTPTYIAWMAMKSRCGKPGDKSYADYAGRGITVCDRWLNSFQNFVADMGERPSPKHSIDRINNEGNYEPTNCRWATQAEQQRNRRDNVWITIDGVTKCIADWAKEMGINHQNISWRMRSMGWSGERAVLTPVKPRWLHERDGSK